GRVGGQVDHVIPPGLRGRRPGVVREVAPLPEGRVGDAGEAEPRHAEVPGGEPGHGRGPGAAGHELFDAVAGPGDDEVVDGDVDVLDPARAEGAVERAGGGEPPDLGGGPDVDAAE